MTRRVGILLSHPTQYHSPWFKELAQRPELEIKVFYCFLPDADQQGVGFGVAFHWDMPLIEGYPYTFLQNIARKPGFNFSGCDTPEIAGIVSSREFDAWIVNGWRVKSEWQAIKACWKTGIPMLIRGDSNLLNPKPLHVQFAKRLILGRWLPRFSSYLTVGKLNEDFYRFYGADETKFFPVRHYVDNQRFAAQAQEVSASDATPRSHWGIPQNKTVFLFAGKFIAEKRPMDAIQAIERLREKNLDVHLLMVGDGRLHGVCEEYALERRLPISFTGFLNQGEIAQAYSCSDVLILPSGSETWGLVVNEAMSCGLPAIVSNRVGCGPDLVRQGKTGLVFSVGNVDSLSEAMALYAQDSELIQRHGKNAQQLIQGYSVKAAADNTIAAIQSVA